MSKHLTTDYLNFIVNVCGHAAEPEEMFELGQSLPVFFTLADEDNIVSKLILRTAKSSAFMSSGVLNLTGNPEETAYFTFDDEYSHEVKESVISSALDLIFEARDLAESDPVYLHLPATEELKDLVAKYPKHFYVHSSKAEELFEERFLSVIVNDLKMSVADFWKCVKDPVAAIHDDGTLLPIATVLEDKILNEYTESHREELLSIRSLSKDVIKLPISLLPFTSIIKETFSKLPASSIKSNFQSKAEFVPEAGKTYKLEANTPLGGFDCKVNPHTYEEALASDKDIFLINLPDHFSFIADRYATALAKLTGKAVLFYCNNFSTHCDYYFNSGQMLATSKDSWSNLFQNTTPFNERISDWQIHKSL